MLTRFVVVSILQNIKSLCCIPKTDIILYVNYIIIIVIVIIIIIIINGLQRLKGCHEAAWTHCSIATKTERGELSETTRRPTVAKCCFRCREAGRWSGT